MATTYRITADIKYLDGALAGLVIPAGYNVTFPTRDRAISVYRWLTKLAAGDFTTAAGTGNRYTVIGHAHMTEEASAPSDIRDLFDRIRRTRACYACGAPVAHCECPNDGKAVR